MMWSEMSLTERIESSIKGHQRSIDTLTKGRGLTHEVYLEDSHTWLTAQGCDLCISTLKALLYD